LNRKVIITDDGSSSLALLDVKEHYHSTFGAIQEAQHVYLLNGLKYILSNGHYDKLSVLEVGFGTGLNAFLTFLFAKKNKINIDYFGIEAYPLKADEVVQLNYVTQLKAQNEADIFANFHRIKFEKRTVITPSFSLTLNTNLLEKFNPKTKHNLIYFDAFGPAIQPELWTVEIFRKMYKCLLPKGVLVTYSAKGQVRRNMQQVGFTVERLPGPPKKREILRATKP